jgi:hypothetical protein
VHYALEVIESTSVARCPKLVYLDCRAFLNFLTNVPMEAEA